MFISASSTKPYRSSSASASRRGTLFAIALAVAMVVFVGALIVILIITLPPPSDAKTGCALAGVEQHVVFSVDLSDPIPANELRVVLAEVERRAQALPIGSRLTVQALGAKSGQFTEPLFDRCKPRDGAMVSAWTANKALQDEIYDREFAAPLKKSLDRLTTTDKHDNSPIIESLAAVATDPRFAQAHRRILVVVGDMIEHSAIVNMYRPGVDFAAVERAGYKPVRDLKLSLTGAQVTLLQVRRAEAGRYQTSAQHAFWVALMAYAGVNEEELRYERL